MYMYTYAFMFMYRHMGFTDAIDGGRMDTHMQLAKLTWNFEYINPLKILLHRIFKMRF